MSEENVEIVRTAVDAFNRRDGPAMSTLLADDAEMVPVRAALEGTVYRGRDAGAQYRAAVDERWADLMWDVEEFRDGGDWVLALGQIRARGRDSGVAIDSRAAWLAQFRGGLITHFQTYANRAEALEAAGLSEQGDTARAMSQENVQIVRQAFEAEARRDFATLHSLYVPEIEMDFSDSPFADFAGRETHHGLGEVLHAFRDFYAAFGEVESELGELIDAGEHVISVFSYRGRGRASGVVVEWKDMAGIWTLRESKIVRVTWLRSREQALEAAGLSE